MYLSTVMNFFTHLCSFIEHQENGYHGTTSSADCVPLEKFDTMMTTKISELETRLTDKALTERVEALEAKLKSSQDQILELKNKDKDQVVFSAAVGTGNFSYGPYDIETILKFQAVITNIGNAYDKDTGYFVAPFSGIYYFVFFLHAGGEHKSILYLYKGKERIVQVQNHKLKWETASNGGNAVLLELEKNDKVSIFLDKGTHVWISKTHTTFSGFLVKRTEAEKADSTS